VRAACLTGPRSGNSKNRFIAEPAGRETTGPVGATKGVHVIVLGLVLLVIGLIAKIAILSTVGGVLVVVGALLAILGGTGRRVGGRAHWY